MSRCKFLDEWGGQCENIAHDGELFCSDHKTLKCCCCGAPATHTCGETGTLICGALLCDKCKYTIAKDGIIHSFNEREGR